MAVNEIAEMLYAAGHILHNSNKDANRNFGKDDETLELKESGALRKINPYINDLQTHLREYDLTREDICIISFIWYRYFGRNDSQVNLSEIIASCSLGDAKKFAVLDRISPLIEKQFLSHGYSSSRKRLRRTSNIAKFHIRNLDNAFLSPHSDWLNHVISGEPFATEVPLKSYSSNEEYLGDWFKLIERLEEVAEMCDNEEKIEEHRNLEYFEEDIVAQERNCDSPVFPLRSVFTEFGLDTNEQKFIVKLLKEHIENTQADIDELLKLVSKDSFDRMKHLKYFKPESRLVKNKLISIEAQRGFMNQTKPVSLQMAVAMRILGNEAHSNQERLKNFIAGSDLFTYRVPVKSMNDIILSDEVRTNIMSGMKRYNADVYSTLESWGLYAKQKQEGTKHLPKLVMLFYGAPGTGKTLVSEVIAKELGKDLLVTDCARVMSPWVGESQKNTAQIFIRYDELAERLENPPILLLNECDQLLTQRSEGNGTSVDKMYHQMQNILLEGIENFRGILILTTNLADSLDQAFSRRFDLKMEFKLPNETERKSLWELHLLDAIPGSKEIDTLMLAKRYQISGGQTAVIIENAATEAAAHAENERYLTDQLLVKYCELETRGQFETGAKRKIGF